MGVAKTRNSGVDALKAFLIFGVILVHLIAAVMPETYSAVPRWISMAGVSYYFMPLFVAVAGYYFASTLQKSNPLVVVINKAAELLLPVCIWYGSYALIRGADDLSLRSSIWVLYYGVYGKVWFLGATFASLFLIVLIWCLAHGRGRVFIALSAVCAVGLHFVYAPGSLILKWNYHVPYLFPFAVLGYLFGQKKSCAWLADMKCGLVCMVPYLLLCVFAPDNVSHWKTGTCLFSGVYSWQEVAWCSLYRNALAVVGIAAMVPVLAFVWKRLSNNVLLEKVICVVGRNTLAIYIVQSFVVERWIHGMELHQYAFFSEYATFMSWVGIPLAAVLITVALAYACVGLKHIPYLGRVLFGCKLIQYKKTL
ncbi:MAG: acyltransferase family protein [Akkermansia sp.]|nr:acyltransferase family protein [Akkermansia sp.]